MMMCVCEFYKHGVGLWAGLSVPTTDSLNLTLIKLFWRKMERRGYTPPPEFSSPHGSKH